MDQQWVSIVSLAIGLLSCFFGYRLRKLAIGIFSFCLGFFIGSSVTGLMTELAWSPWLVGAIVGVLFALVGFKVYRLGVFLLCGGVTFFVFYLLIQTQWVGITVGAIAGILVGLISLKFLKPVIILSTSICSGLSCGSLAASLFGLTGIWITVIGVILAALGCLFQFSNSRGK